MRWGCPSPSGLPEEKVDTETEPRLGSTLDLYYLSIYRGVNPSLAHLSIAHTIAINTIPRLLRNIQPLPGRLSFRMPYTIPFWSRQYRVKAKGQGGQSVLVLTWDEMEIWGGVRACAGDMGPLPASTIRNRAQVKLGYGFQHIYIPERGLTQLGVSARGRPRRAAAAGGAWARRTTGSGVDFG